MIHDLVFITMVKELVTKNDIKWWKALTLSDCKAFEKLDSITQTALSMKLVKEDGFSEEEAAKHVRKSNIFYYGNPEQRDDEPLGFIGEDAKLPYIVKIIVQVSQPVIVMEIVNCDDGFGGPAR